MTVDVEGDRKLIAGFTPTAGASASVAATMDRHFQMYAKERWPAALSEIESLRQEVGHYVKLVDMVRGFRARLAHMPNGDKIIAALDSAVLNTSYLNSGK